MKIKPKETLKSFKDGLAKYYAGKGKRYALTRRHGLTIDPRRGVFV